VDTVKLFIYNQDAWWHGRQKGAGGTLSPIEFWKYLAKKVVFLVLSGKKQISPLLHPPGKHSSDAHAWRIITAYYIALKIQVPHAKLQRTSAKSVNELDNTNTMPKKNSCFHTKIHFHSRQNAQRQNNF